MTQTREEILMLADDEERASLAAAKFWKMQSIDSGGYYDSSADKDVIIHAYEDC